jgi:hypothetical protein
MSDLPYTKMYALRHGQTNRIWQVCEGWWLFKSVADMERTWNEMKKCGRVGSEFHAHKVVTIKLVETQ